MPFPKGLEDELRITLREEIEEGQLTKGDADYIYDETRKSPKVMSEMAWKGYITHAIESAAKKSHVISHNAPHQNAGQESPYCKQTSRAGIEGCKAFNKALHENHLGFTKARLAADSAAFAVSSLGGGASKSRRSKSTRRAKKAKSTRRAKSSRR